MNMHILDFVDAASRQCGLIQVIKVRMSHGLTCWDPLGRIVGQHFLKQRKMIKKTKVQSLRIFFFFLQNVIMLFKIPPFLEGSLKNLIRGLSISPVSQHINLVWFLVVTISAYTNNHHTNSQNFSSICMTSLQTPFSFSVVVVRLKSFTAPHENQRYCSFGLNQRTLGKLVEEINSTDGSVSSVPSVEHKLCSSWWQICELKLRHLCKPLYLVVLFFFFENIPILKIFLELNH